VDLHLVNYNRTELPPGPDGKPNLGAGIADEQPVPVGGVTADIALPAGATLRSLRFLTPEQADERVLQPTAIDGGRVRFQVPEFLVYGVVRIEFDPRSPTP